MIKKQDGIEPQDKDILPDPSSALAGIIRQKDSELQAIYTSRGWKILLKYYALRDSLMLQPGSVVREAISGVWRRILGVWRRFSGLWRKIPATVPAYYNYWEPLCDVQKAEPSRIELGSGTRLSFGGSEEETPEVSILIVPGGTPSQIYNCLALLRMKLGGLQVEAVITEPAGHPDAGLLKSKLGGVLFEGTDETPQATALNMLAAKARGRYLLFVDPEAELDYDCIGTLIDTAESSADVAAVCPRVDQPNGRIYCAGGIFLDSRVEPAYFYGMGEDTAGYEFGYLKEVDFCHPACMLVRRTAFEALGGLDAGFAVPLYASMDFSFRLWQAGLRILYQPRAKAVFNDISYETGKAGADRELFYEKWHDSFPPETPADTDDLYLARDRSAGKRILLFIDTYVPTWDKDAGSVRMYEYLKVFKEMGFKVVVWPDDQRALEPYTGLLQASGFEVVSGQTPWDSSAYLQRHGRHLSVTFLSRPTVAMNHIDNIRKLTAAKIIYDIVDLHFLRYRRMYALGGQLANQALVEYWKQIEMYLIRNSDISVTLSDHELELILAEEPEARVIILPYIQERAPHIPGYAQRSDIMFIGGFNHKPNEDAVLWFCAEILPLIKIELPEVRFFVLGADPTDKIRALVSPDVIVTGFLEDVTSHFSRIRVFVSPLRFGAGIKGKIVHAMSAGLPVVSTAIGAEGMGLIDGQDVMVADNPAEFAKKVVSVYREQELWESLSSAGLSIVDEKHSVAYARAGIVRMIEKLLL